MPRRSAAEAAATRRSIVEAARLVFAADGYQATTLDGIARQVGVTRGAVHHHFGDKRVLFVEVFQEIEHEIDDSIVAAALDAQPEGLEPLRAGCRKLFELYARPDIRRIVLADAPAVLGLVDWYQIDRALGMTTLRAGLRSLADDDAIGPEHVEPLALLLYGALTEAALALGTEQTTLDPDTIIDTVEHLLTAFRGSPT